MVPTRNSDASVNAPNKKGCPRAALSVSGKDKPRLLGRLFRSFFCFVSSVFDSFFRVGHSIVHCVASVFHSSFSVVASFFQRVTSIINSFINRISCVIRSFFDGLYSRAFVRSRRFFSCTGSQNKRGRTDNQEFFHTFSPTSGQR